MKHTKYTIKGVSINDIFVYKNHRCKVVDIGAIQSLDTGKTLDYICYAQMLEGLAKNVFEVPFSTVKLNKVNE